MTYCIHVDDGPCEYCDSLGEHAMPGPLRSAADALAKAVESVREVSDTTGCECGHAECRETQERWTALGAALSAYRRAGGAP